MTKRLRTGAILGAVLVAAQLGFADNQKSDASMSRVEREVRREIVTLPYYSLFDHFAFRVDGETVTLMGKVTRPSLKSDAENVIQRIEGVERINNEIEVLPLSSNDDRLRLALYYAIYGHSALQTLAIRAVPPVHIIVENGKVTLEGVVASEMQKTIANTQANGVSGVFSVANNLHVESKN
jgi:hyperosmotically inducible periplasmic protein